MGIDKYFDEKVGTNLFYVKGFMPSLVVDNVKKYASKIGLENTKIYFGFSPAGKEFVEDKRTNPLEQICFGVPSTIAKSIFGKLFRMNSYCPYSNSVSVYQHKNNTLFKAIKELELANICQHPENNKREIQSYISPFTNPINEIVSTYRAYKFIKEKSPYHSMLKRSNFIKQVILPTAARAIFIGISGLAIDVLKLCYDAVVPKKR